MKITIYAFVCVLASISLRATHAETNEVRFEEVLSRALAQSPLVKSIDAKFQAGLADAVDAKAWKNPSISSSALFPVSYPDEREENEIEVALSQPIKLSDFGLRSSLASLIDKASRTEQKREILEFSQEIRLSYLKLWALQSKKASLLTAEKRAGKIRQNLKDAESKGLFSKGEVELLNAALIKLKVSQRSLDSDIGRELADILRLTQVSLNGKTLVKPNFPSLPERDVLINDIRNASLPIQERAKVLKNVAERQLRIAKRDTFPELTPQIIYKHSDDDKEFVGFGLSFEFPVSGRAEAEKIKRDSELQAAGAEKEYYTSSAFEESLLLLADSYKASIESAESYEKEVIPSLSKAVKSFEELLYKGQGSAFQLWQTQSELNEAQDKAIELLIKATSERVELSLLIGSDI